MLKETFDNSQPAEPKFLNWPRIILTVVLGTGLLTVAAYIGYWYGMESVKIKQISKRQSEIRTQEQPTVSSRSLIPSPEELPPFADYEPPPFPSIEEMTKDWKIYENSDYRYEVKYPKDWVLKLDKQVPNQIVSFLRSDDQNEHCGLSVYGEGSSTSLPEGVEPIETELITVGGATPLKEVYSDPFGIGTTFWWIKFPEKRYEGGGVINQITAQYDTGDHNCPEFLDVILSTFKFLD